MEKETQQREGHPLTRSLPHRRVLPKSDTSSSKMQASDQEVERFLRIVDLIKPHLLWVILVAIAIYDYFHTSNVFEFLILIAAAAGAISLTQALDLLRGRSMPMRLSPPSEEREVNDQPGETAATEQDEQA